MVRRFRFEQDVSGFCVNLCEALHLYGTARGYSDYLMNPRWWGRRPHEDSEGWVPTMEPFEFFLPLMAAVTQDAVELFEREPSGNFFKCGPVFNGGRRRATSVLEHHVREPEQEHPLFLDRASFEAFEAKAAADAKEKGYELRQQLLVDAIRYNEHLYSGKAPYFAKALSELVGIPATNFAELLKTKAFDDFRKIRGGYAGRPGGKVAFTS
jgi:hypothetical protein